MPIQPDEVEGFAAVFQSSMPRKARPHENGEVCTRHGKGISSLKIELPSQTCHLCKQKPIFSGCTARKDSGQSQCGIHLTVGTEKNYLGTVQLERTGLDMNGQTICFKMELHVVDVTVVLLPTFYGI